jgi:hypothetical protein
MLKALTRMSLVNMRPALAAGDAVPTTGLSLLQVANGGGLSASSSVELSSLMRSGVPLVLNFGSCS